MTPTISNSNSIALDSGTVFGNTATVNCTAGYTGNGPTGVITCGSGATWGGFTCIGKVLIWYILSLCIVHLILVKR